MHTMTNVTNTIVKKLVGLSCITSIFILCACNNSINQEPIENDSICEILGEVCAYEMMQNYIGFKQDGYEFDPMLLCEYIEEVLEKPNAQWCIAGASIEIMNNDWRELLDERHGVFFYQDDVDSLLLRYLYVDTIHQIKSVNVFDSLIHCFQNGTKDVYKDSIELLNIYTSFTAWNIRYLGIADTSLKDYVIEGMEYFDSTVCLSDDNKGWHYYLALRTLDKIITDSYVTRAQNIDKMIDGFIRIVKENGHMKNHKEKVKHLYHYFDTLSIEPWPSPITLVP